MIGYWCYTCNDEHAYRGDCPYEDRRSNIFDYRYDDDSRQETVSVSIPSNMKMNEEVTVYVNGRYFTLKRTK